MHDPIQAEGILETDHMWSDLESFKKFIAPLERSLDYEFKDKSLLREALTMDRYWEQTLEHFEDRASHTVSPRRLAFLGDVTLSFIATKWLYKIQSPSAGDLHRFNGMINETMRLAQCAEQLNLPNFMMPICFYPTQAVRLNAEVITTALEAVIGAWSLDDPSLRSLTGFLVQNIFSIEDLEDDLRNYGLTQKEFSKLKAAYPSLWSSKLRHRIDSFLGPKFKLTPKIRIIDKREHNDLPEYCAAFYLGEYKLVEEWGRTQRLAKRYALFRCAFKLINGYDWIDEIIANN